MTLLDPAAAPVAPTAGAAARGRLTATDFLLVLMALIWGVNTVVAKAALGVFDPLEFNAFRFGIAGVLIVLIARRYGRGTPARADWLPLAALGILGNAIYQVVYIEGLAHTRAGNAALIMGTGPVFTATFSHLRGHDRLRLRDAGGILVSTSGLASITLGGGSDVGFAGSLGGDVLVLFATICWSAYTVGLKPYVDRYGHITSTAWTMAIGAVVVVLVGVPAAARHDLATVPALAWGAVAYSATCALVIAFLLWYRGVEKIGSTRTATYSNFQPVIVLLLAWPLLHETPTLWQVLGAGGIFTGIYLIRT
jgi:drug/metabolite transporter (DMT)-like permease